MEFLDNTGHIFSLKSHDIKPIGHEYDENDYIFWLNSETENFLSVNNYYMRSIYALIDLSKYGISKNIESDKYYQKINIDDELKIDIEIESNKYTLIGSADVQEKLSENEAINDLVDLSDDSLKTQHLTNNDLLFIKTEGVCDNTTVPFVIVPFYVICNSSEEGTWLTNILIHVTGLKDETEEYCSITVGGEFRDNYEELMINAQNMGVYLPKNIIKSIYSTSYYNNEFNEVIFNQKIKEYMMNYMNIRGEQGNFKSVIDSLNWFGWGDKIDISKLLKTDNEFKTQYFLDYFSINNNLLESYKLFKNTSYISLKVKLNNETGEYYDKIVDKNNKHSYFEGEENRIVESLLDKQIPVVTGFDNEKFVYMKQYYDFMLNELGLKLACLKYYYQKYFLPIHIKIHGAYLAHKVYANDIKLTTIPKIEMSTDNIYLPELSRGNSLSNDNEVEFPGHGVHYFIKQYDFFIDEQYNEFNLYQGYENDPHKDFYYVNDTCINIPITFKNFNKQYNCVLVLEKEIEASGNYNYVYTINNPFKYYEAFAYKLKSGQIIEYKDILMAYREFDSENENFSIYSNNSDLYNKVRQEISKEIPVSSNSTEEYDEDNGYDLEEIYGDDNYKYKFNYCGYEIFISNEETYQDITINNKKYTLIIPSADQVDVNLFQGAFVENGVKNSITCTLYRISLFEIKFKTVTDEIESITKYSEAGIKTIDNLKLLPQEARILKYEDRRKYIIDHYEEYKWVELINSIYVTEEDIFNIVYNTVQHNIDYNDFINTTILASTLDEYRRKNLTTNDILTYLSRDKFEGRLYSKSGISIIWDEIVKNLIINKDSYLLDFNYKTNTVAETVYESHFIFSQKGDRYYKNFIICPRIMKQADMRYWQDARFRLSLLVNNKWYEYRFVTKMPEPHIQLGKLTYRYWETDENFYSKFSQIKYLSKDENGNGEIIFNNFMYEPSLVTINNVNYYDDLLEENSRQHIVNYNSEKIDLFNECQDFIIYNYKDCDYIIKFNSKLIYSGNIVYIPGDIFEEEKNLKEIVIYTQIGNNLTYFVKRGEYNTYEYKFTNDVNNILDYLTVSEDTHSFTNETNQTYYIKRILYNSTSLRDKYKFDIAIPNNDKYLNSVCLFDLYKETDVYKDIFLFRTNHNLSVNGVLFVNDVYSGKFVISGKQLYDMSVSTGEIKDKDGNVLKNGYADMYHDRWYNFEQRDWSVNKIKKYAYYIERDQEDKKSESKISSEPSINTEKTIVIYEELFNNVKDLQKFIDSELNEKLKEQKIVIFKENNPLTEVNTYYVTDDNYIHKYILKYSLNFVVKDNFERYTVLNNKINQPDQLRYIADKYYLQNDGSYTPIKIQAKFYFVKSISTPNIPVFIDVNKKYHIYKINNNIIDENLFEIISDNEIRYVNPNEGIDTIFKFVEESDDYLIYSSEDYEYDLKVFDRIKQTEDEGYMFYNEKGENPINLVEIEEFEYVDYNGNPIGKDNPINYWVELEEQLFDSQKQSETSETKKNIKNYLETYIEETNDAYKDLNVWTALEFESFPKRLETDTDESYQQKIDAQNSSIMQNIIDILQEKTPDDYDIKTKVDPNTDKADDANRFDYFETEEVNEFTEYKYNKNIYVQQDVVNLSKGHYRLTWDDAYNYDKSFEDIHNSISLAFIVRDSNGNPVKSKLENYGIYQSKDYSDNIIEFDITEDDQYITVFFLLENNYKGNYDGYWITPKLTYIYKDYTPLEYKKASDALETEIQFEFNKDIYSYGTNQTPEILDLYSKFFKEKYIVYRNQYSDSITQVLEREISGGDKENQTYEEEQIDAIIENPLSKYIKIYEQLIDLRDYVKTNDDLKFQLDYDMYLMHDSEKWYCMFISRQTIDKANNLSTIYNLKHSPIEYIYKEGTNDETKFKLEFNRYENKFLLNRYYCAIADEINQFEDTDIITAQLVNNDRLPVHLDISAKYRINSLSIGNLLQQEVDSNNEMAIINIQSNNNKYLQGYYKVDVNYSLDGFTQQSYKDAKKFKIYKS